MGVVLKPAFVWWCNECSSRNVEEAKEVSDIDTEDAAMIAQHFETLDATKANEEELESPYLVTRVVCGPPFVSCRQCGTTHAAMLEEDSDDH